MYIINGDKKWCPSVVILMALFQTLRGGSRGVRPFVLKLMSWGRPVAMPLYSKFQDFSLSWDDISINCHDESSWWIELLKMQLMPDPWITIAGKIERALFNYI